jgi:hypothetical protein
MSTTEQILDLIINYIYSRKEEIEKYKVLLGAFLHHKVCHDSLLDDFSALKVVNVDIYNLFFICFFDTYYLGDSVRSTVFTTPRAVALIGTSSLIVIIISV